MCFFLILLLVVSCGRQDSTPYTGFSPPYFYTDPYSYTDPSTPYFWKAEKEGKVTYLLGTIHVAVSLHELPCAVTIEKHLKNSDLVFLEMTENNENEEDNKAYQEQDLSPNGEDFKTLTPESQKFLIEHDINSNLNYLNLWLYLDYLCMGQAVGLSSLTVSMDSQVEQLAKHWKIPRKPLDTPTIRAPMTSIITAEDVESKIQSHKICVEQMREHQQAYKTGNLSIITNNSDFNEVFLKNRNELWLSKLKSELDNYNHIFIAAGALHFIGAFNLVDMLKEEQFSVERMSSCP